MNTLDDLSKMPFGKYKGENMQDIPDDYLFYLWNNGKKFDKQCNVADYIRRNIPALSKELPDAIWT